MEQATLTSHQPAVSINYVVATKNPGELATRLPALPPPKLYVTITIYIVPM